VKLTDFGIAKAVDSATLTATGKVVGTAQYLSPEQATGGPVTAASDVYALGVVAHEMLAGRPPFTGTSAVAVALAQVRDPPPPLPAAVPPALAALVADALAKDPSRRPADGAAFAARLRSSASVPTQPVDLVAPHAPAARTRLDIGDPIAAHRARRRAAAVVAALVALLAIAGGVVVALIIAGGDDTSGSTTAPTGLATSVATATTPAPSSSTVASGTTPAPATTPVPTTAPGPATLPPVNVDASQLVGKKADEVVRDLERAGLVVAVTHVESEPRDRNKVIAVEPTGLLPAGSEVRLEVGAPKGGGP